MGGPKAPLSPQESVTAMRRLIDTFGPNQSGKFHSWPVLWAVAQDWHVGNLGKLTFRREKRQRALRADVDSDDHEPHRIALSIWIWAEARLRMVGGRGG
jgi:hypothetical protein